MKTEMIKFRVSEEEATEIRARAAEARMTTSDFLRQLGMTGKAVSMAETQKVILALNRIGVNINQIARTANQSGYSYEVYEHSMLELEKFRQFIRESGMGRNE